MTDATNQAPVKTIFVIDDEQSIRDMYKIKLVKESFAVLAVGDGEAAIAQAMEHRPDLLLVDVHLGGMNGFEAVKKIRAQSDWGARVPVIYLTNDPATTEVASEGIEKTGPAYYLIKSNTELDEVVAKIREVLAM